MLHIPYKVWDILYWHFFVFVFISCESRLTQPRGSVHAPDLLEYLQECGTCNEIVESFFVY